MEKLSTQEVLARLDIPDFNYMTIDNAITMASLLDKMDPESAKVAMGQFPDFSNTMRAMLTQYKSMYDAAMDANRESTGSFYRSCDDIICSCQRMLDSDYLSFDDKKVIIAYMVEIANMKSRKDTENKKYNTASLICGTAVLGIASVALIVALGGKAVLDPTKLLLV